MLDEETFKRALLKAVQTKPSPYAMFQSFRCGQHLGVWPEQEPVYTKKIYGKVSLRRSYLTPQQEEDAGMKAKAIWESIARGA